MGKINVQGLGVIQIEGDKPNTEEIENIKTALVGIGSEQITEAWLNKETDSVLDGVSWGRIELEVAGAIGGSILTGGLALPAMALRISMLSRPFLMALARASAGSGAGSALGAVGAETFDPSENVMKEIARAAGEGALAEAVGAPLFIKGGKVISKILGKPRKFASELVGAVEAEKTLTNKANEILYGKIKSKELSNLTLAEQQVVLKTLKVSDDSIREYMKKQKVGSEQFETVRDAAIEMQKGLTPAIKTKNQAINIMETIFSKSLLGGGAFAKRYRSMKQIGDRVAHDIVQEMTDGSIVGGKEQLGNLFYNTFTRGEELFRTASDDLYKRVDVLLGKNKFRPLLNVMGKDGLDEVVKTLNKNINLSGLGGNPNIQYGARLANIMTDAVEGTSKGSLSYAQLAAMRSELAGQKQMLKMTAPKFANDFNAVLKKMDDMLSPDNLVKSKIDPAAGEALGVAKKFYEEGKDVFQRGTVMAILNKGAKETADMGSIFHRLVQGNKTGLLKKVIADIDQLPIITKGGGPLLPEGGRLYGKAVTQAEAVSLKESLRGHFLSDMLEQSKVGGVEAIQFGEYISAQNFTKRLHANRETLDLLYPGASKTRLDTLKKALGYAQGEISDVKGIPGGVLIQMKQAGAAGQVLQLAPALMAGGAGALAVTGNLLPAAAILIAPKYLGKAMLDPKFQQIVFKSQYQAAGKGTLTPSKAHVFMRQAIGRLLTLGVIDDEQAKMANLQIDKRTQMLAQRSELNTPLPNVAKSDFPIIEGGMSQNASMQPAGNRMALAGNDPLLQGIAANAIGN